MGWQVPDGRKKVNEMRGKRLNVGIVGLGAVAQAVYLPLLQRRHDLFRIAAVTDLAPEVATAVASRYGLEERLIFPDSERMLEDAKLDAVILLNSGSHASTIMEAALAGCAVLCEKPLAYTHGETREVSQALAQGSSPFQLGYMKLYDPAYRRLAASDLPGELRSVDVTVLHPSAQSQLAHANLIATKGLPAARAEELRAATLGLCHAALGDAAPDEICRLYTDVIMGSIVHDLSLIRPVAGNPVAIQFADMWPRGVFPPSLRVVGLLPEDVRFTISWHYLPDYPAYREEVSFHCSRGSASLVFPAPYLLNAPTTYNAVSLDGTAETVLAARSTVEAFEAQLAAFHALVTEGVAPAAGVPEADADITTCQMIAARLMEGSGIAIGGEAAHVSPAGIATLPA